VLLLIIIYQNSGDLMEKQHVAVRQTGRCNLGSRYNEYVNFSWLFQYEIDDSRFFAFAHVEEDGVVNIIDFPNLINAVVDDRGVAFHPNLEFVAKDQGQLLSYWPSFR
jgi:hypothetical protein